MRLDDKAASQHGTRSSPRRPSVAALLFLAIIGLLGPGVCNVRAAEPSPNPRAGFYQWVGVTPPGDSRDLLTIARERIKAAGAGLMRIYVGARFDYVHPLLSPGRFPGLSDPTPAAIIDLPYYRAVLDDPAIRTVVLTAYPGIDYGAGRDDINMMRPFGEREAREEHDQILALARYLFQNYGDAEKTVIIANTEADDKMLEIMNYTGSPQTAIDNLRAWQNTRYAAVDEARRMYPRARLKVLSAFEVSLVNARIGKYDGRYVKRANGQWNALRDVVPHVRFDLLSYSAYESTNAPYDTARIDTPPADTGARLLRDLRLLQKSVSTPVMIGELGIAYDLFDRLPSGGVEPRLASALKALEEARAEYVVFWQVFDAPPEGREPAGFGWLDPKRKTSPALLDFIGSYKTEGSTQSR